MGTIDIENAETTTPLVAITDSESRVPSEASKNPLAKVKVPPADWVYWIDEPTDQPESRHLTYQALRTAPSKEALHQFEQEDFPERQAALAELRMLEREVSLKGLPAALVLIPVAVAIIGNSLKSPSTVIPEWVTIVVALYVVIAAILILWGIKDHARKEACLNAWTKAFEDSHARAIKKEEEQLKADFAAFTASANKPDNSGEPQRPNNCPEVDASAG